MGVRLYKIGSLSRMFPSFFTLRLSLRLSLRQIQRRKVFRYFSLYYAKVCIIGASEDFDAHFSAAKYLHRIRL